MNTPLYNTIGASFRQTRRADPRIVEQLIALLYLPTSSVIADIGAGTGNYSNALAAVGFTVHAVEPSSVMRAQATPHPGVEWHEGVAEALPLPDASVDGIICTLALHHFTDVPASIREMRRVVGDGPIVLFTFDPRQGERFWLYDYFPVFESDAQEAFPPIKEVASWFADGDQWLTEIHAFPLLADLQDNFCAANWRNPARYLDPAIQAGTSSFTYADAESVQQGLSALQHDLVSGRWEMQYGHMLERSEFDAGYRFLTVRSNIASEVDR